MDKLKKQLFSTIQFPVPNKYRIPKEFTFLDYQNDCLEKIEKRFSKNNNIAAFIMESGAQMAGGVIIYPKEFQKRISKLCKKYERWIKSYLLHSKIQFVCKVKDCRIILFHPSSRTYFYGNYSVII